MIELTFLKIFIAIFIGVIISNLIAEVINMKKIKRDRNLIKFIMIVLNQESSQLLDKTWKIQERCRQTKGKLASHLYSIFGDIEKNLNTKKEKTNDWLKIPDNIPKEGETVIFNNYLTKKVEEAVFQFYEKNKKIGIIKTKDGEELYVIYWKPVK